MITMTRKALACLFAGLFCVFMATIVLAQDSNTNVDTTVQNIVNSSGGGSNTPAFPIPGGGYQAPSPPGYWGVITPDGNYEALKEIVMFKPDWNLVEAEKMLDAKGKVKRSPVFVREYQSTSSLTVVVHKPSDQRQLDWFNQRYELIGYNTTKTKDSPSPKGLGGIIKDGLKGGAVLVLYNEGAGLELKSGGWGIGLNNSVSMVNGGANPLGNVTAAGIGYTSAWARYATNPWLQVKYFRLRPGATGPWNPPAFMPTEKEQAAAIQGQGGTNGPEEMTDANKLKYKAQTLDEGKRPRKKDPTITTGK